MLFVLFCLSFLSILSVLNNSIWQQNIDVCVIEKFVSDVYIKRENLLNSLAVSTYTSLGVKRRSKKNVKINFDLDKENAESFKDQSNDIKRFRSIVRPESSRIDLCSTIMVGSEEFKKILERLMLQLYGEKKFFKDVYEKRPNLCYEILDKLGELLRELLGWNSKDNLYQSFLVPDTLWLFYVFFDDEQLNEVYQKMIKCNDDSFLKYVSINRWHPKTIRYQRVNISLADKPLLYAIFGRKAADLIIQRQNEIFSKYLTDNLEKESNSGMFVMIRPAVLKKIVMQSCEETGVDFSSIENCLDFGRFFPARNEWLIDNKDDCRIFNKPKFL